MPYIAPAWHCTGEDELLQHYKSHGIIHGTRTLDEYYYHLCDTDPIRYSSDEFNTDSIRYALDELNTDQILTKSLHDPKSGPRDSCVLVNVNQLWIWIPDPSTSYATIKSPFLTTSIPETIITSATHRRDSEYDPVFAASLEALREAIEGSGTSPKDAFSMADLVTNSCIGMLSRYFEMRSSPNGELSLRVINGEHGEHSFPGDKQPPQSKNDKAQSDIRRRLYPQASEPPNVSRVCIKEAFTNVTAHAVSSRLSLH